MKSEWLQANPDRGKITDLQHDVMNLRDRMEKKMRSHLTDILNLLIPEQRSQAQDSRPRRGYNKKARCGRQ